MQKRALWFFLFLIFLCTSVNAHPGRTDANGCHTCRTNCAKYGLRDGEYHCHGSKSIPKTSPSLSSPKQIETYNNPSSRPYTQPATRPLSQEKLGQKEIRGKVVGIADGDTITVLQDRTQYKIRLYGIDCPESHQDFGTRAKQFTSDLVFGKEVLVVQKDMDRYGRVVGMVYLGDACANEEIIRNGLAWVYHQYCKEPVCSNWTEIQTQAKNEKIGLWSHPNAVPPWEFRRGGQKALSETESTTARTSDNVIEYHGNISSKVFHKPGCQHYNCKNCVAIFADKERALEAGYRPCGICKP